MDDFDFFSHPETCPWKHLWNTDGGFNETMLKYRVAGTPSCFIFDKIGNWPTIGWDSRCENP